MQALLCESAQFAATEAGAAECAQVVAIRPLHGLKYVGTIAGAADGNEQIAGLCQVFELLDENAVKTFVVAPCQYVRRVVCQTQDAQPFLAVVVEILSAERAFAQILAEMRAV